jgi:hypothetical protein
MYVIDILVCGMYHNFQYYNVWMCVEKIHKVVGDIYVLDILVYGTYDNF